MVIQKCKSLYHKQILIFIIRIYWCPFFYNYYFKNKHFSRGIVIIISENQLPSFLSTLNRSTLHPPSTGQKHRHFKMARQSSVSGSVCYVNETKCMWFKSRYPGVSRCYDIPVWRNLANEREVFLGKWLETTAHVSKLRKELLFSLFNNVTTNLKLSEYL